MRWRDIEGYEGMYQVSDTGLIRSLDRIVPDQRWGTKRRRGGLRKRAITRDGYYRVTLIKLGRPKTFSVHSLVLSAFVGPRPAGMFACHNDGDPANNDVANLRWDTAKNNTLDSIKHGTNWALSKTECPQGHAYTPENTYRNRNRPNKRDCLTCRRDRSKASARRARYAS